MQKIFFIFSIIISNYCFANCCGEQFLLFSSNVNNKLVRDVSEQLGGPISKTQINKFSDGEINVNTLDNVREKDVFIIHSTCTTQDSSVNDNLMELYLIIRTLKRSSAHSVTAIIPYYGYARQDRKLMSGVPISASDIAMLLETAGVDRVLSLDLHCGQIQGFFHHIPVDNLYSTSIFAPYCAELDLKNIVVVAPDAGALARAKKFKFALEKYNCKSELAIIIKQRSGASEISQVNLVGSVENSDVIIVDDICDTAGTLVAAAKELKKFGAKKVYACITHPVFSGPAKKRIENSVFEEILVTDTIPLKGYVPKKVKQLSIAKLLSQAILRIHKGRSISDLFVVFEAKEKVKRSSNITKASLALK
jgi:ribose-phosphate pyrophosphokinase